MQSQATPSITDPTHAVSAFISGFVGSRVPGPGSRLPGALPSCMTFATALAVALGGAVGSLARYALGTALLGASTRFPVATLLINVAGSFALGFLLAALPTPSRPDPLRAALTIGVCGGFTTFSTFSAETVALFEQGATSRALVYVLASVTLSLVAVIAGAAAARVVSPAR
jgi:fluoride exporter